MLFCCEKKNKSIDEYLKVSYVKKQEETMSVVLIVEDNEMNVRLFSDLLKSKGYSILTCTDSTKALQMIKDNRPNVVLMDIQMPEISGLELTKLIRADKSICETKIVAVSAFAMDEDIKRIREAGCDDYISKPIEMNSFFKTVAQYAVPFH